MALTPKYSVYHSAVLDADPDEVWAQVRDMMLLLDIVFGDGVENAHWTNGGSAKKVPSRFEFTLLPNHDLAREEVVGRSETDRSLTYRSVDQVLFIVDYLATYRVRPVTNEPGRSFIDWHREFRVVAGAPAGFLDDLEALFEQEIATVKAHFAA
ncbi:polyketide cyclase/dehydrase/lipid transport protein [Saccharothrix carnea]|uniref:Polyketide cyclase/dehydrase/lipid transport protein n=1 Tax=Saccharothrix carnea TaxID=1280637 RepID=A0A2P8IFF1_SACCR|nr:SRPBCC family protein [Saccharothrix carnea]PSL57184.1 polyketide cyclase/dehydrase/lipid transport protein [Saccharothrix carnea]